MAATFSSACEPLKNPSDVFLLGQARINEYILPIFMNDFLRPCNCEHPTKEDCDKCIEEASPNTKQADVSEDSPAVLPSVNKKSKPVAAEGSKNR